MCVSALKVEPQTLVPLVQVQLRPEVAANFGLTPAHVRRAVTTLVKGQKVGEVFEEQRIHEVAVWSQPVVRGDLQALRELLIETPGGGHVPLGDVADLAIVPSPNEIKREGSSRRIDVTCNVAGRDLGSVARDLNCWANTRPAKRRGNGW
jgi:Cu/Ag efflux pump CusA